MDYPSSYLRVLRFRLFYRNMRVNREHSRNVRRAGLKRILAATYNNVVQHNVLQMAAALSYYLVLAVFPSLIFLSVIMGSIPLPGLFGRVVGTMALLLPRDTMCVVQSVLLDVLATNRRAWLSFATLGGIWVASAAFDALIESLDVVYSVHDDRPFWATRFRAICLGVVTAGLVSIALVVMMLGPRFGAWLASRIDVSTGFVFLWPLIHWTVAIVFTLVAVELLYFLAPNVKQRFGATLPGAILAVTCWIGLSYLLGFYVRHIANLSRTYGTLAGFIAFMTWFYWNSIALLVGAELNAELARASSKGQLPQKHRSTRKDVFGPDA
jgi:membrane protein